MKATDAQVRRILDELDFTDGSHAHDEIRRGLEPVLDEVIAEVLRQVRDFFEPYAGRRDMAQSDSAVRSAAYTIAAELEVSL